jgi:cyclopropane-fatty-acyl-phospholipid synthase
MFEQMLLSAWSEGLRDKLPLPLRIELWDGRQLEFFPPLQGEAAPRVTIRVPDRSALRYLRSPSLYQLGRAYVEGAIDIKGRAVDIIHVGNALAASLDKGRSRLGAILRLGVRHPPHTREVDAEAIRYHYDVSNDFYAAWLDPAMVYSCAYFEDGSENLATAQQKKIDHILRKIDLRPGQRLLDIGCGWGALVLRAAQAFGARCIGVTLSENQARLARERIARAGMARQVEIRLLDYRDIEGEFDRVTSVGMFEHVGVQHLPDYFSRMSRLLAPDGVVMNHGITTCNVDNHPTPYGGGEFIDRYVFPHGELAHLSTVVRAMQEGGLEVRDVENLRRHYAKTCMIWTDNFEGNAQHIRTLTDEKHFRIWHLYLAGCAYAFAHGRISLYQIVCGKTEGDVARLPWSRKYMYP